MADFTANAWIVGGRWRHHRTLDHFGSESTLYVTLAEDIGPWAEGTPVHYVIEGLLGQLSALESSTHVLRSFAASAVLLALGGTVESPAGTLNTIVFANATIRKAATGSFTFYARIVRGGTFTLNAVIRGGGSFTAKAVLI